MKQLVRNSIICMLFLTSCAESDSGLKFEYACISDPKASKIMGDTLLENNFFDPNKETDFLEYSQDSGSFIVELFIGISCDRKLIGKYSVDGDTVFLGYDEAYQREVTNCVCIGSFRIKLALSSAPENPYFKWSDH